MYKPKFIEMKTRAGFYRAETVRSFIRYLRSRPATMIGLTIVLGYAAIALLDVIFPEYLGVSNAGTLWSFSNLSTSALLRPSPPTFAHGWWYLFGTTFYGLPIFPVMLASVATDLKYSFLVVFVSALIGTFAGAFSASFGKTADLLFMRGADVFLSFPAIIVVILFASSFGWNYLNISIGIIIVWWTVYARISRGATLPLREATFIEAGVASGCSEWRLLRRHIFPNIMSLIFVQMTLDIGLVISIFAAVNFLFSPLNVVDAFVPEIGNLMVGFPEAGVIIFPRLFANNQTGTGILLISGTWWPIVIPGLFLVLFIIGLNLLGIGLRDFVSPKNRGR